MRKLTLFALTFVAGTAVADHHWEFDPGSTDPIPAMQLDVEGREITARDVASWWARGETFRWDPECVLAKNAFNKWMSDAHDLTTLALSQDDPAYAGLAGIAAENASIAAVDVVSECNAITVAAACDSVNALIAKQVDTCGYAWQVCQFVPCIQAPAACQVASECESALDIAKSILCP